MPNITVNPVNKINVRVNQGIRGAVTGTTAFYGNANIASEITVIHNEANIAYTTAQTAILEAGTGYNFVTQGGSVNGNVAVSNALTVGSAAYISGNVNVIGDYVGTIDGGIFS